MTHTLITCHRNADFDAVASLVGAFVLFPDAAILFPGTQEKVLQKFFEEIIIPLFPVVSSKDIDEKAITRLVIVDTRQQDRLEHVSGFLNRPDVEIYVWDHHPEGDIVPAAGNCELCGATATLLTEEIKKRCGKICCECAHILALGIYVDTGSFCYVSTTQRDFLALAWLTEQGFSPDFVVPYLRHDLSREHLKALNDLLESAQMQEFAGISFAIASTRVDGYLNDFATLAPRFMELQPCQVLFALGAMEDKIQLVARSKHENVDVGKICALLGGGGHRYAAAAAVKDKTLPELKDFLFSQISLLAHTDKTAHRLMSSPPVFIQENQTIQEAEEIMSHYGMKALPVFQKNTHLCVGWLEHQLAGRAISHGLGHVPVSAYMQRNFQVVAPNAGLQTLMDIIVGGRQRLVPVVNCENKEKNPEQLKAYPVIGVVTRTDLIRIFLDDQKTQLPQPRNVQSKRNLTKSLRSRTPKPCVRLLELAGMLGSSLGINVYVVGGYVRDLLLDQKKWRWPNMDVDLVVEGDGIAFAHALAAALRGRVSEHTEFMTALVIYPASSLETDAAGHTPAPDLGGKNSEELRLDVATARLEYYSSPAALPTVELSSIKMDLNRRDFTINAMAIQLNTESFGTLVDFFDGQDDIRQKRIRMLHALSFIEDPTRALRAVRFEQRYGFKIGPQCDRLIRNAVDLKLVDKLSGMRIFSELELILAEENPLACIRRLQDFNLLEAIHPELKLVPHKEQFLESCFQVYQWYQMLYMQEQPNLFYLVLLSLCRAASSAVIESVLRRLAFTEGSLKEFMSMRSAVIAALESLSSLTETTHTETTLTETTPSILYGILGRLSIEALLFIIARTDKEPLRKELSSFVYQVRGTKLDISGEDILRLGVPTGPTVGKILQAVLYAKLDGKISNRDEQLVFAQKLAWGGGD